MQATKAGNVAVNSSFIASSFSSSDYLKYVKSFDFSKPWEFKVKVFRNNVDYASDTAAFVYSAEDGSNESLYTAGFGLFLGTSFTFNFRDGGGNQLIAGGTVNVNTTYWLRCGWTGTEYYMDYSTDGTNYTSVGTLQSSSAITQTNTNIVIGASLWIPSFNWKGTIDLKEMSMTIDNVVVWTGVADISPRLDDVDDTNIYTVTGTSKDNIAINGSGDVVVGGYINNQDKSITANGTYTADAGYTGLGTVNVNVTPRLGAVNIPPKTTAQTATAAPNFDGFYKVTVPAVTSSIDNNITAGNIKNGVTILGVTGTYSGGVPQGYAQVPVTRYTGVLDDIQFMNPQVGDIVTVMSYLGQDTEEWGGDRYNTGVHITLSGWQADCSTPYIENFETGGMEWDQGVEWVAMGIVAAADTINMTYTVDVFGDTSNT
mgnify:CR=1 FL=1